MNVKLVHITPEAENHIVWCARVSSDDQFNPEIEKLIKYCIKHGHWSIFEQASMNVEIVTSRAISAQILRHKSFSFQEFSMRYANAIEREIYPARRQDLKNRQNSIDDMSHEDKQWFVDAQCDNYQRSYNTYNEALSKGIAKEQARMLLPMSTQTKLYMHGTIRSFIHYLQLRTHKDTQLEHREIAEAIKVIFKEQLPIISKALDF